MDGGLERNFSRDRPNLLVEPAGPGCLSQMGKEGEAGKEYLGSEVGELKEDRPKSTAAIEGCLYALLMRILVCFTLTPRSELARRSRQQRDCRLNLTDQGHRAAPEWQKGRDS